MNVTKQNILLTSLKLFNDRGVSTVSLRSIADEAGISVGNLQYHFKKREDIIEALYFQLVEKIDGMLSINDENLLKSFFNVSTGMFSILFDYHFFLLDFVTITRNNKKIKKHYAELSKLREQQFLQVVKILVAKGLFREEKLRNEYQSLFKRIEVISNFWFSSILIEADTFSKEIVNEYTLLISQSIYPYLTEESEKQYKDLFTNQLI